MKKTLFNLFIFIFVFTITPNVMADNHNPNDVQITDNLKERLIEVVKQTDINQVKESSMSSYVGQVTDIVQKTIILKNKDGKKLIRINEDSHILRSPGSKTIKLDSIQIDDSIIAIGSYTNQDELMGKRIIVSNTPLTPPEKISGLATIKAINKYSFSLSQPNSNDDFELFFTKKTLYKSPSDILTFDQLTVGDQIIYTAIKDKDGDWSATIVMQTQSAKTPTETP